MTLAELRERVSVEELCLWEEYYQLSPWDGARLDYLFALVCFVVYSMWRGKGSKPMKLDDFLMPWGGKEVKRKSPIELASKFRAAIQALGGKTAKHPKAKPKPEA